jgi:predicted transcriptional regulator
MKTPKQLERHFKGIANHWRIAILLLVDKNEGLSVDQIAQELEGNFKTISQHTRYLVQAGLLQKQYQGRRVIHFLSPYGKTIVNFIKSFQSIESGKKSI